MSSATESNVAKQSAVDAGLFVRILQEGYGPGAWHGNDLKAAIADVTSKAAFQRPAAGRHNIAEIAVHHAYTVRSVRERITGKSAEPFALKGEDWFELSSESALSWKKIQALVAAQQQQLEDAVADLAAGRVTPVKDAKPFDLILGITCHAIYHAGQIQLIKRLQGA